MIDFNNKDLIKLKQTSNNTFSKIVTPLLIANEQIVSSYQTMRDGVVFTNLRVICINVQGLTGAKKDFTSLPYSKIQAYSIETSGVFDIDTELELYFSSLGKVRLEFSGNSNVSALCQIISQYIL